MGRRPCCDKMGVKKGHWSPEEDRILSDFIHTNGIGNWRALAKKSGLLRCGKSCRLRWINYLRPDIKRGDFSSQEEAAIVQLHKLLGNRWSRIASCFPGRTDNEIKNVWNTKLKKSLGNDGQSLISLDVCMQESTSTKEVAHANNLSLLTSPRQPNNSPDFPTSLFFDSHNMSSEISQSDCMNSSVSCKQHSSIVADGLSMDETFILEDEERWLPRQNQIINTSDDVLCEKDSIMEAQYFMSAYVEDDFLSCMNGEVTNSQADDDDDSDCTDYWFKFLRQIEPPHAL